MPSRNVVKLMAPNSYYHVYGRGGSRQKIFLDDEDYSVYLNLLKRYLSPEPVRDKLGRAYPHLRNEIELIAYCLMPNHFHLMVYQHETTALPRLMRAILTSYSSYFNNKYDHSGPLFESRYKAARISNDTYLMHISRYIHLNPQTWQTWPWSSIHVFQGKQTMEWVSPERVLELFTSNDEYFSFINDYEERADMLKYIKHELASE